MTLTSLFNNFSNFTFAKEHKICYKGMFIVVYVLLLLLSSHFHTTSAEQNPYLQRTGQELLLCRKCGADVADSNYLFSKHSPGALKVEKQNLFGRKNITVQTLINPFNVQYNIITTEKAKCKSLGPTHAAESWFPGYTWRVCTCPHCGYHLGWTFESSSSKFPDNSSIQAFHGLILNNILGENFTDSLIMMPKMFKMYMLHQEAKMYKKKCDNSEI